MNHYKDAQNNVYAYESDGSQDSFILPGLTPITNAEATEITAPPPPTADQLAAQIDAEADTIIGAVIGNRAQEYVDADAAAAAYKAAGYSGPVPGPVQVWATVEGRTAAWAADNILAQADAWRTASLAIRQARLTTKKRVRDGDAAGALAAWAGFVSTIKTQLGVA